MRSQGWVWGVLVFALTSGLVTAQEPTPELIGCYRTSEEMLEDFSKRPELAGAQLQPATDKGKETREDPMLRRWHRPVEFKDKKTGKAEARIQEHRLYYWKQKSTIPGHYDYYTQDYWYQYVVPSE
jgi:hypothetical protein